MRHQRSYLGNWQSWWPHLRAQANQAALLSGPGWLAGYNVLAVLCVSGIFRASPQARLLTQSLKAVGVSLMVWSLLAAPLLTGILFFLTDRRTRWMPTRFLSVAWVVMFGLSPFYHPYARLWLPLEQLHWLLLGGLSVQIADHPLWTFPDGILSNRCHWISLLFSGLVVGSFLGVGPGAPLAMSNSFDHAGLFDPSDSLRTVASEISTRIRPDARGLRVLVRPAFMNYLPVSAAIYPQRNLDQLRAENTTQDWAIVDSTLITGELTGGNPGVLLRHVAPILGKWEIVAEFPAATTLPTALDLDPMRRDYSRTKSMACFWLLKPRSRDVPP